MAERAVLVVLLACSMLQALFTGDLCRAQGLDVGDGYWAINPLEEVQRLAAGTVFTSQERLCFEFCAALHSTFAGKLMSEGWNPSYSCAGSGLRMTTTLRGDIAAPATAGLWDVLQGGERIPAEEILCFARGPHCDRRPPIPENVPPPHYEFEIRRSPPPPRPRPAFKVAAGTVFTSQEKPSYFCAGSGLRMATTLRGDVAPATTGLWDVLQGGERITAEEILCFARGPRCNRCASAIERSPPPPTSNFGVAGA